MVKRLQKKEGLIKRLTSVLIFLVTFNLLAIPLYIGLYTDFSFEPLQKFDAKIVSATLHIFGYSANTDGIAVNLISDSNAYKIDISWDSTAWKSMYAVASLIIATPILKLSKRLKFAAIAVAIIFFINYLRITTTILISTNFGFNLFDIVHTVLWREGLILAVVAVWLGWMRMEKYNLRKIK